MSFKDVTTSGGIYRIRNIVNGKIYIGSTVDFRRRFRLHKFHLDRGTHHSPGLQRAWKTYGAEAFAFEVLEIIPEPKELISVEQRYLDQLCPFQQAGYNVSPRADSCLGVKRPQEERAKRSADRKALLAIPEEKEKWASIRSMGNCKGGTLSAERRAKLSAYRKGKKPSAETSAKLTKAMKDRYERDPSFREKQAERRCARNKSEKAREATRKYHAGLSAEAKATRAEKARAVNLDKNVSAETRMKLRRAPRKRAETYPRSGG